ncbi:ENT domain, partial [Dillenia turbinata]
TVYEIYEAFFFVSEKILGVNKLAMDYEPSDSSGTDDDLPASQYNRVSRRSRFSGDRRSIVGSAQYPRLHVNMESQIHQLEQEAYSSVLRAFKAQSDAITWEKEGLITELRKELRVSDDEHRELLAQVNADEIIHRISIVLGYVNREWRQAGGHQSTMLNASQQIHDQISSPTISASRKKQKTSQSLPSLSLGVPSPAVHHQSMAGSVHRPTSAAKRGAAFGARGKKHKTGRPFPGGSSMNSRQFPSIDPVVRGQIPNSVTGASLQHADVADLPESLISRRVLTRWPEDRNFYEAVISDYNPTEGRHALIYDINTAKETWEWVNLKEHRELDDINHKVMLHKMIGEKFTHFAFSIEYHILRTWLQIPPEDIRWVGDEPGISQVVRGGQGRGSKNATSHGDGISGAGIRKGSMAAPAQPVNEIPPSQNGSVKQASDDIELFHTDTLIKEVVKVLDASNPDIAEIGKAKKMLKDHEQALVDAIARLGDVSDGERDKEQPNPTEQTKDQEQGCQNQEPEPVENQNTVDSKQACGEQANDDRGAEQMAADQNAELMAVHQNVTFDDRDNGGDQVAVGEGDQRASYAGGKDGDQMTLDEGNQQASDDQQDKDVDIME